KENEKDLSDIPPYIKRNVGVVLVEEIDEVLDKVFVK
ncbi:MAG TPA: hypothetical protein EYP78_01110, partial [Candidatus Omnitrophica bacterium]|nr:hypothetical protein [Candidatus Omnitrophota bacterium]